MGDILKSSDPNQASDDRLQAETGNPLAYPMMKGGTMPSITLETKQSGKIGSSAPTSGRPLREAMPEPTLNNPDVNQHEQFVKPNEFEHSPGAFNH